MNESFFLLLFFDLVFTHSCGFMSFKKAPSSLSIPFFFLQGIYFTVSFIPFDIDYPFRLLSFDHTMPLILGYVS